MIRLSLVLFIALLSFGQGDLSAPRIGTVLSADGYLRDIEGVPGACRFVMNQDTGRYLAFQPASHGALTLAASPDTVVVTGYGTRRFGLTGPPRAISLSPKGTFSAVVAGGALTIYSLTDPDILPRVIALADISIGDDPLSVAVSDKGVALLSDRTHIVLTGVATQMAQATIALSFIRFQPGTDLAVAFSDTDRALVLVHTETLGTERLLGPGDGLGVATGIEISNDGNTIWISQSESNLALRYLLDTRSVTSFDLSSPGALRSIGLPGVFLWNDTSLLDAQRSAPQLLLIASEVTN